MSFERPEIVRPPSEWRSYFLPLTKGCSNNTCTFCQFYGSKLRLRDKEEVKREIDALALYLKHGLKLPGMPEVAYWVAQGWDGKRVFLQDADALVYPFPALKEVLEYLNEKLPGIERVGVYATPQDLLRRSLEELRTLRELKLSIIYMGLESGDDEVLRRVGKGVSSSQIIEAGRKAIEAGITLSVTVILGLGGVEKSRPHALATAKALSQIDPQYAAALTLLLVPGTPLYEDWKEGRFSLISPFESLEELKLIIENSEFTDCFFSSMHASNYLPIRGRLPQEKKRMLRELEEILARREEGLLRPEFMRAL